MKKEVIDGMQTMNCGIRLLFATEAYGMGADPKQVRRIIHAGVPRTMESM